jgi:TolB protein
MDQEQPTPESEPPSTAEPAAVEAAPAAAPAAPAAAPTRPRRRLRFAVALTLIAAVAVVVAAQVIGFGRNLGDAPEQVAAPPRIAIVDANGALATMDERGGSVVPHPVNGVKFQFPAWSPDGSRVAAIGNGGDSGGVWVFQARGADATDPNPATEPAVIYRSPDQAPFYLYWTPDGRQVTFLTNEPDGLALRVAPADGSSAGSILRKGAPLYWDWVDPARALVNAGAGGPDAFLGEIGLDGAAGQPTATASIFRSPAVTRDGSRRAYIIEAQGGSPTIIVEARDGAGRHEIAVPGFAAIEFAPAGTSLAFIAPAGPSAEPAAFPLGPLRVVDVASGSVRTILDGSVIAFFWSPDGKTIATLRLPSPGDEDVASAAAPVPPSPVATDVGYVLRLIFVDVASGSVRSSQAVRVTELFGLQVLPFFDQYALSHRPWSPDSSSVLLPLVDGNGVDGLVVLPADGSAPRRIADGEMGFWSP